MLSTLPAVPSCVYSFLYFDGMNGTRDYRSWSGGVLAVYMLILIAGAGANGLVEINNSQAVMETQTIITSMITLSVPFAMLRPYKSNIANITGLTLSALLAITAALYGAELVQGRHRVGFVAIVMAVASTPQCVFYSCK